MEDLLFQLRASHGDDVFPRSAGDYLQLLIVTPLQKIHIIEPYVSDIGKPADQHT